MSLMVKGISSEFVVIADLIKQGYNPSIPALPNSVYDVIAEKDFKLYKIQIKSGEFIDGKITVHSRKSNGTAAERRYTVEEVDIIAVHDRVSQKTAYITNQERTKITLYEGIPVGQVRYRPDVKMRVFSDYLSVKEGKEEVSA